ncbi:MAG: type IV toxin-antitoxin system AbiEi family antitoxin domain-containing protein [Actinomycetota bacterium]
MKKGLKLLDDLVATGRSSVTPAWVMEQTGASRQACVNLLTRLAEAGLLERVSRGHYAVRQIGVLGTSTAAEDLALAVDALFEGRPHRIAFRTALQYWGLLTRPSRVIQVASPVRVAHRSLSGRPLKVVYESPKTVAIGAVQLPNGVLISSRERALLECAERIDLAGGIETVVEALTSGESFDVDRLTSLAKELGARPAIRRIGSLADALELEDLETGLEPMKPDAATYVELEPSRPSTASVEARDREWGVRWRTSPEALANVAFH